MALMADRAGDFTQLQTCVLCIGLGELFNRTVAHQALVPIAFGHLRVTGFTLKPKLLLVRGRDRRSLNAPGRKRNHRSGNNQSHRELQEWARRRTGWADGPG